MRFDYDTELKSTADFDKKQTHMLSDGNIITVAPNVSVARVFFQPSVIGKEAGGVHDTSSKELYVNVVLSGGTTKFHGFFENTTKELTALTPTTLEIKWLLHQSESTWYGPSHFNTVSRDF